MNVPFGEEGFANCDAVHVENRNLVEVPAMEKAGMLFVIPNPNPGGDVAKQFAEALPVEMEKELAV